MARLLAAGVCLLALALTLPLHAAWAQSTATQPKGPELIAVLDLEAVGSSQAEATALTERLREVLLKSQQFVLVDRSQMKAVLDEQALQQTGCTDEQCAVQVGQILGVRKIVSGRAVRAEQDIWLLSVMMVDVETAHSERGIPAVPGRVLRAAGPRCAGAGRAADGRGDRTPAEP
ncbi:MAG TPA: CsgG/HfaB family protein [bacterium]|nr:CsgG/HfaB family protein [bacterium]